MPIERRFLGWDRPALHSASQWLIASNERDGVVDLAGVVVALSGRRGGQHLLDRLLDDCAERGVRLHPPRIVTAEPLANLLLKDALPIVPQPLRRLAWLQALGGESDLADLVPMPPEASDLRAWSGIGQAVERLHVELSSAGQGWADVVEAGRHIEAFDEEARWQTIGRVIGRYMQALDALGMADPQQARIDALAADRVGIETRLVLVGLADMNPILKQLVERVSDQCVALLFAPETCADRFDACGCIRPQTWAEPLPLDTAQMVVADRPQDQATAALERLAQAAREQAACLAVVDEGVMPALRQQMRLEGIPVHRDDFRMAQSRPHRLLEAIADHLDRRDAASFAALIRHGDFENRVMSMLDVRWPDWLGDLDQFISDHLPGHMAAADVAARGASERLVAVVDCVDRLFAGAWETTRSVRSWGESIGGWLTDIYGAMEVDPTSPEGAQLIGAIDRIVDALRHVHARAIEGPEVPAAQAIRWWLSIVADEPIPAEAPDGAVEVLGWLGVLLDDATVPILIGCNEHALATASRPDGFLPESLRASMGLTDRSRRYARDAYALRAITASRPGTVLISGRHSSEGEPLMLSRLLLADGASVVADRILRFVDEPTSSVQGLGFKPAVDELFGDPNRWPPQAQPRPMKRLKVTAFADYLRCPYRFYLQHVLKLRGIDDAAIEMDGAAFGNAVHGILNEFADSSLADSSDEKAIIKFLDDRAQEDLRNRYGADLPPAVRIQQEQLRDRLVRFATWQARWHGQGWNVVATESDFDAPLPVDGTPFTVYGRIDRIDRHRETGDLMVFDYKTGSRAVDPDGCHRRQGQWIDLQLPLYHHLASCAGYEPIVGLGYIALPADADAVGAYHVSWSDQELDSAIGVARQVVGDILAGRFELDLGAAPRFDPYSAICGVEQFRHLRSDVGGVEA